MKVNRYFFPIFFILIAVFVIAAAPTIDFVSPTPANGSTQSGNSIFINLTTTSSSDHYTFVDFDNSLIGWWRMDSANSTTVFDESRSSMNMTLTNGAFINSSERFGNTSQFDGVDDAIVGTDFNGVNGVSKASASLWVRPRSLSALKMMIGQARSTVGWGIQTSTSSLGLNGADDFLVFFNPSDGCDTSGNRLSANTWVHFAFVFDGTQTGNASRLKFYVNGANVSIGTCIGAGVPTTMPDPTLNFTFGAYSDLSGRFFNGSIDEVIVFNRSLSAVEISSLYNASVTKYQNDFTNLSDGIHTFKGYSVDTAGNRNQTELREVTIDLPPNITVYSPLNTTYYNETILINFTADHSEEIDSKWFYNGTANVSYASEVFYNLSRGQHTFIFYANNTLNELGSKTVTFVTNSSIDLVPPTVNITFPLNNTVFRNLPLNLTFNITINEPGIVVYSLNGGGSNYSMTTQDNLTHVGINNSIIIPDGRYTLSTYAQDLSGNQNNSQASIFYIDTNFGNASVITQFGIIWTFNQTYPYGRFVSGDYWVVGPVNITSVSPEWNGTRHGTMVNPNTTAQQGYDTRAYSFNASLRVSFPKVISPNSSVISTNGLNTCASGGGAECLSDAAVLTIVSQEYQNITFRPSYFGTEKYFYNTSQVNYGLLPNLEAPSELVDVSQVMVRPWIDHGPVVSGAVIHPQNNMPSYPRDSSVQVSQISLMAMISSNEQQVYANRLIQLGIDLYPISLLNLTVGSGQNTPWQANGGFSQGRKWPILFAGIMLNNSGMKSPPLFLQSGNGDYKFGEDGYTYYGNVTEEYPEGKPLFGIMCDLYGFSYPWFFNHLCRDPGATLDPESLTNGGVYRICCTSYTWVGQGLAAQLMNAEDLWNHTAYFDYLNRWTNEPQSWATNTTTYYRDIYGYGGDGGGFMTYMWENYWVDNGPDTTPPTVTLVAPINGSSLTNRTISFNATFSDNIQLRNATLYVWNSTHSIVNQTNRSISGTVNSVNITVNLPYEGTFRWNYLTSDNSSNSAFASSNYTLTYSGLDSINPNVTSLTENPSDPVTYSTGGSYEFNASITDNVGIATTLLQFNGINYTAQNISLSRYNVTLTDLAAGIYTYTWIVNDTSGNINNSESGTYTINNATGNVTLLINGTAGNQTIVYGAQTNASGSTLYGSVTLYRNNIVVNNNEPVVLGVGDWNFTAVSSGDQNHSAATITRWTHISQATPSLNLTLNVIQNNVTVLVNNSFMINGTLLTGDSGGILRLYQNGTLINQGTREVSNLTSIGTMGLYNITVIYVSSQNYTQFSQTYYVNVTVDTTSPEVTINLPTATTYSTSTLNFNVSLNENGSIQFSLDNGVTNYSMSTVDSENFNYSFSSLDGSYTFRVYANDSSGNRNDTETVNFTVSVSSPGSSGGSSGGGGGGGGGGAAGVTATSNYWVNTYESELEEKEFVRTSLISRERTKVEVDGEEHHVGIVNITSTTATVNVSSTPQQKVFAIGESYKFDVNDDEYYDLLITLEDIIALKAYLLIENINEYYGSGSEQNNNDEGTVTQPSEKEFKTYYYYILLGVTLLVIVIVFFIIRRRTHKYHRR